MTILPNDDPYGIFSFDQLSLSTTITEPQGATSTANGKIWSSYSIIIVSTTLNYYGCIAVAQLTVVRGGGLFEQVTVPYEVRQMGSQQGE